MIMELDLAVLQVLATHPDGLSKQPLARAVALLDQDVDVSKLKNLLPAMRKQRGVIRNAASTWR